MDYLANLVRPSTADLVDHAAQAAALLVRYMGKLEPLWSPVMMNGACIAQLLIVMDTIKQTQHTQQEMTDRYRLFHCYIHHRWGTQCDMVCYRANVQAPLFCFQQEAAMRLRVTIAGIREDARQNNQDAAQVASWVKINERAFRQRYAQELEEK